MSKNFESCHKINWNRTELAQKNEKEIQRDAEKLRRKEK